MTEHYASEFDLADGEIAAVDLRHAERAQAFGGDRGVIRSE